MAIIRQRPLQVVGIRLKLKKRDDKWNVFVSKLRSTKLFRLLFYLFNEGKSSHLQTATNNSTYICLWQQKFP